MPNKPLSSDETAPGRNASVHSTMKLIIAGTTLLALIFILNSQHLLGNYTPMHPHLLDSITPVIFSSNPKVQSALKSNPTPKNTTSETVATNSTSTTSAASTSKIVTVVPNSSVNVMDVTKATIKNDAGVALMVSSNGTSSASEDEITEARTSKKNHVQFVFVVGLEGTGHHFMGAIAKQSPAFDRVKSLGQPFLEDLQALQNSLFEKSENGKGLWTVHPCFFPNKKPSKMDEILKKKYSSRLNTTATIMRRIENFVRQINLEPISSSEEDGPRLVLPINTATGGRSIGEMSYPNFKGPCRSQQYPKLFSWYEACTLAQVDCRHVYLYRDVYEVTYSTTVKRKYNPDSRSGLQLYEKLTTDVLLPELTKYASHSAGCVGFYDPDHTAEWKDIVRRLWQWTNATEFSNFIDSIYKPPHANTTYVEESIKSKIVKDAKGKEGAAKKSMAILDSWLESQHRILRDVCHFV